LFSSDLTRRTGSSPVPAPERADVVDQHAVALDAAVVRVDGLAIRIEPLLAPARAHLGLQRLFQRGGKIDVERPGLFQQALVDAHVGRALAVAGVVFADAHEEAPYSAHE